MKFFLISLLCIGAICGANASSIIIDDFTFTQGPFGHSGGSIGGVDSEISDPSVFGGERRLFATGYLSFFSSDTAGTSLVGVADGSLHLSKTAVSGSAFVSYNGRLHTLGDRIGDLSLDIAGSGTSLASPILFLQYNQLSSNQIISISLASSVDAIYFFDILLLAGSSETYFDIAAATPFSTGATEALDFSSIEEIGLGLFGGRPIGSLELRGLTFVPEPSIIPLGGISILVLLRRRRDS